MPDLVLKVAGSAITGWETLEFARSIEAVSGSFILTGSDREGFPVPEGAAVELFLEGFPLLTGWADSVRPSFSARERRVTVQGRDKTGDLVDCVPVDAPAEFEGLDVSGLASELARPFGIQVVVPGDPGPVFEHFALQPGETVFEALERAARLRGVLLTTNGLGQLVIERPGTGRAVVELVQGRNVLAGSGHFGRSGRFRRYVVRGQLAGSDVLFDDDLRTQGEAFDDAVRESRSTLILAEAAADLDTCQARAEWEATVRRARGSGLELVVRDWRQAPGGPLWRPNLVVHVRCPWLRVDRELLISAVRYRLDMQGGTACELELVPSDSFQRKPVLEVETDLSDEGEGE